MKTTILILCIFVTNVFSVGASFEDFFFGGETNNRTLTLGVGEDVCQIGNCGCVGVEPTIDIISYVNCSNVGLDAVGESLILPESISTVDLSNNKIQVYRNNTFETHQNVKHLNLSYNLLEQLEDNAFSSFHYLQILELQHNGIGNISSNAFQNLSLINLNLAFNQLTYLPNDLFDEVSSLVTLNIANNPLIEFHAEIFVNLPQLKTLSLAGLRLTNEIDPSLFANKRITTLDISNNLFQDVPIESLRETESSLITLDISGNPVKVLNSSSFNGLIHLEGIKMNNMADLRKIQEFTFQKMENLKIVEISDAPKLKRIDPKAFYLSEDTRQKCPLNRFVLQDTSIEHIDKNLLYWDTLSVFVTENNPLVCDCKSMWLSKEEIQDKIQGDIICNSPENLKGKKIIDLEQSQFKCPKKSVLPEVPNGEWNLCDEGSACTCPSLENIDHIFIDCSDAGLTAIHDNMFVPPQYKKLDFSQNLISKINSETFAKSETQVELLDLSSNHLDKLDADTFLHLVNLKHLDLYDNKIYNIEKMTFNGLHNLTLLELHSNNIAHLPETIFDPLESLEDLNLAYNQLETIDGRLFQNLKNLKSLDLSFLKLKSISSDVFKGLPIKYLNLDHNELEDIPIKSLEPIAGTLNELILSANPIQKLDVDSFKGLHELKVIEMKQMLVLQKIGPYTFHSLHRLEKAIFMYMPKFEELDEKAFHLTMAENVTCPIKEFIFSFTTLSTMGEALMKWDQLSYFDMKQNKWNCDCNLAWMKDSIIESKIGEQIYCSYPTKSRGITMKHLKKDDFTCGKKNVEDHSSVTLGLVITLMIIALIASLGTVAFLSYKRNGFLFSRIPKVNFNYGRLGDDRESVMVIEG